MESEENESIKKEAFFQETVTKSKGKFLKNSFLKLFMFIFSLILGIVLSFSVIFLKDTIIPQVAQNSVSTSLSDNEFEIQTISSNLVSIIENTKPSIVSITSFTQYNDFFNNTINYESPGSGIIFHKTADEVFIVTNYHTIENADAIGVAVEDNEPVMAELIAKDANNDLAVIVVSYSDLVNSGATDIKVAKFASSSTVLPGDSVIAIGNALGEGNTATFGIISATSKDIVVDGVTLNVLQTDAAINPGNSGGALINLKGEVIGINVAKSSEESVEGIGYSISTDVAMPIIEQMLNNTNPATLGVSVVDASQTNSKYSLGAMVVSIVEDSPADNSSLQVGDIITSLNDTPILSSSQLVDEIKKYSVKDRIKLTVLRDNEVLTIKVKL